MFRNTRAAFEVLRDMYEKNAIDSFTDYLGPNANDDAAAPDVGVDDDDLADLYAKYSSNTAVPSYEYFEEAAKEDVPGYKVELAKSGRSKCTKCNEKIAKDGIRVGWLDKHAGR